MQVFSARIEHLATVFSKENTQTDMSKQHCYRCDMLQRNTCFALTVFVHQRRKYNWKGRWSFCKPFSYATTAQSLNEVGSGVSLGGNFSAHAVSQNVLFTLQFTSVVIFHVGYWLLMPLRDFSDALRSIVIHATSFL